NTITNTVKSFVDHSALGGESNVELSANSAPTISSFTFAGAITAQVNGMGGFAGTGAGAGSINNISATVAAVIEGQSIVSTNGSISLTATDSPFIDANAGGFAL